MLAPNARTDGIERVQMQPDTLGLAMDSEAPRCVEASLVCGRPGSRFCWWLLSNHGELPLGFKAMTNAPRRWSVKPNGGVIEPGSTVQIVLSLITARAKESFANDHHLILSLPLQPEDVARLLQLRSAENGRVSIPSLTQDNPQVSQARLSPQLPPPQPGLEQVMESPLANGTRGEEADADAPLGSATSGCPPGVTNGAMHAEAGELATDLSVAERVKDLQRKYSNAGAEEHRAAVPASSRAGLPAEDASASASDMFAASADPSSALSDSADSEPVRSRRALQCCAGSRGCSAPVLQNGAVLVYATQELFGRIAMWCRMAERSRVPLSVASGSRADDRAAVWRCALGASKMLRADREVLLAAVQQHHGLLLYLAGRSCWRYAKLCWRRRAAAVQQQWPSALPCLRGAAGIIWRLCAGWAELAS